MEATELGNDGSVESVAESLIETPQPEILEDEAQEEVNEIVDEELEDEEVEQPEESDDEDYDSDEDVEVDEEEQGSHDENVFTVKVDGEEIDVTLEELTRSYSGQKYIQKGMQQAAEQRKEVEAQYAKLQEQAQQLNQVLQAAQNGQVSLTPPTPPSRELFERDPIGYMDEKLKYEESMQQYQQNAAQIKQTIEQQQQLEQEARQVTLRQEFDKLVQADPDFADENTASKIKQKMLNFAKNVGFTEDDISGITDHRTLLVLKKAALYDELQKAKPQVNKRAKKARPFTAKPGAKKSEKSSKAKARQRSAERMKQTGNIDDVAKFLIS